MMLLDKDWIHSMSHILYSASFKYQKLLDLVACLWKSRVLRMRLCLVTEA